MKKVVLFWSAGKDSAMALHNLVNDKSFELVALVTTLNEDYKRISMHGIPEQLLDRQCAALGLPVIKMWVPNLPDNNSYEYFFLELCEDLKEKGVEKWYPIFNSKVAYDFVNKVWIFEHSHWVSL